MPFSISADITSSNEDRDELGIGFTDKLCMAIAELGRFETVEREELERILQEQALAVSSRVSDTSAAEAGKISGADMVVLGTVNLYSTGYSDDKIKAQVSISVRFIDPASGILKKATQIEQSGTGNTSSEARFSTISKSISSIITCIKEIYPLQAQVARVDLKELIINMGSEMGIKKGQYFHTIRQGSKIIDESTGSELGTESIETGLIKITSVEKDFSKAKIVKKKENIGAGDMIRETKPRTSAGVSAGFAYSGAASSINSAPLITFTRYNSFYVDEIDTLVPDFSNYKPLEKLMGFFLAIDFYQIKNTNMMTSLNFAFINQKETFSAFDFDFRIGYEIPLIADRLFIPAGIGIGLGSYSYKIFYTHELQSQLTNYRTTVRESNASEEISTFTFGFNAFSGLRLKIMEHLGIFAHAGYRYHPVVSKWNADYKTWEWNQETWMYKEVEKNFEIEQKLLPQKNVQLKGLDMRIGMTFLF